MVATLQYAQLLVQQQNWHATSGRWRLAAALRMATTATPENKCRIECQNIICSPKARREREIEGESWETMPAGFVCAQCLQNACQCVYRGVRYANMQQKCILYHLCTHVGMKAMRRRTEKGNRMQLGLALRCQICQML